VSASVVSAAGAKPGTRADFLQIWEEGYVKNQIVFEAMHTQMVMVLEGAPLRRPDGSLDRERIIGYVEDATKGIEMFRFRLMRGVLGLTPPAWVPDDAFDIRRHVLFADGASELSSETLPVLTSLSMEPMSKRHPLWRFRITELVNGDVAIGAVFHHVAADGLAAMKIMASITDNTPERVERPAAGVLDGVRAPTGPAALPGIALQKWFDSQESFAAGWRAYWSRPFHRRIRRVGGRLLRPIRDVIANRPSGRTRELPPRRSDFVDLDSARVAQRADSLGGTLTDLLLSAAMRASWGDPRVRLRMPVSLRGSAGEDTARNRVRDIEIHGSALAPLASLVASVRTQVEDRESYRESDLPPGRQIGYVTVLPWRSRPRYFGGARIKQLVPFPASLPRDELSAGGVLYDGRLLVTVTMQADGDPTAAVTRMAEDLLGPTRVQTA
jgi:diacylglycerol O-acyltransferase